jgi:hypothetical protein
VSLLSRNQLRVGLCPDRLILAAYRGGRHRAIVKSEIVPVDGPREVGPNRRSSDQPFRNWQAAVDALPSALAALKPEKAQVTVILSNHFVRYAVLPWNAALKSADEWLAFARHRLENVHGPAATDWDVRVSATAPQGSRVVSAVDRALLDAVSARVAEGGAALVSVQPHLMAAFNRVHSRLESTTCWLLIDEPGRLTLALIQDGAWHSIRSRRVEGDWRHQLPEILERESAALALAVPCTDVVVHTADAFDPPPDSALRLRDLTVARGASHNEQPLAMALA